MTLAHSAAVTLTGVGELLLEERVRIHVTTGVPRCEVRVSPVAHELPGKEQPDGREDPSDGHAEQGDAAVDVLRLGSLATVVGRRQIRVLYETRHQIVFVTVLGVLFPVGNVISDSVSGVILVWSAVARWPIIVAGKSAEIVT